MPLFPPHLQTLRHIFINPAIQEEDSRVCLETPTQSASRILLWFLLGSICIVILVTQRRRWASKELSDPPLALQLPYTAPRSSAHLRGCCWERHSDRLAQTEKYCMFPELCSSSRNESHLSLPSLQTVQNAGSSGWWDGLGRATRTRQHWAMGWAGWGLWQTSEHWASWVAFYTLVAHAGRWTATVQSSAVGVSGLLFLPAFPRFHFSI